MFSKLWGIFKDPDKRAIIIMAGQRCSRYRRWDLDCRDGLVTSSLGLPSMTFNRNHR